MLKWRRPINYQNKTKIEIILPKFDMPDKYPHTGSKARDVSSLSQTSTITERIGGKMVAQEVVNSQDGVHVVNQPVERFLARVVKPIVYYRDVGNTDRVIVLPGTLIAVIGTIAVIGNDHVAVTQDQYVALVNHQ